MSAKQALNDKLQGSVAAHLRCAGVVNNQIKNTIRYDTRCYFNVLSKADISQSTARNRFIVESVSDFFKFGEYLAKLQART